MRKKNLILCALCFVLAICMFPASGKAALSAFAQPEFTQNSTKESTTILTFAGNEWYVINNDEGNGVICLLSVENISGEKYNLVTSTNGKVAGGIQYSSGTTDYNNSLLQGKIEDIIELDFSDIEQSAINVRTLDETSDDVMPAGQMLWPLSKSEADLLNTDLRRNGDHWWMRSFGGNGSPYVWFADGGGGYYADFSLPNDGQYGIRPAFNLDANKVAFYCEASEGKPAGVSNVLGTYIPPSSNKYKTTLIDEAITLNINNARLSDGKLLFDYTDAAVGDDNYLVVRYKSGSEDYYGVIRRLEQSSGSVSIEAPTAFDAEGSFRDL